MKNYQPNNIPVGRWSDPQIKLLLKVLADTSSSNSPNTNNDWSNSIMTRQYSDARFWFIEGENDAIEMKKPQHPDNYDYMSGWKDAKHRLATGEICWRWNDQQEFLPVEPDDLELDDLRF